VSTIDKLFAKAFQAAPATGYYEGQFAWHRKPAGWTGAPCPICGCPTKRLKAEHRAIPADEGFHKRGLWEKRFKVAFGTDTMREVID
jgi:hypothetical protein